MTRAMKPWLAAGFAILLSLGGVASAHRLDEYLQATILSVDKDHLQASMRLIPGVAVSSSVLAGIDSNGDGVLSQAEQQAYAKRVLGDLSLTLDGKPLHPRLDSAVFPPIQQMKQGLGEIQIGFTADLPPGGPKRTLVLENHHQARNAAWLVNTLVPSDPDIHLGAQTRNEQQSFYRLDYMQAGVLVAPASGPWWIRVRALVGSWSNAAIFPTVFRLGMRHIAQGTDHLLFLLALLLPAPLLASGSYWTQSVGVRRSLFRILKIVTAFTLGHSLTLALASLGLVHVPSSPIEVLIAVSILVSAIHALRPLFPGKEPAIAAFFGLIHGLAFAATFSELGLGRWERVVGILAFNLGIETMQLVMVAVTLPSLLLLSRTRAYPFLRIGGALFAGCASVGWIAQRLFGAPGLVDAVVGIVAQHGIGLAGALLLISLGCCGFFPHSTIPETLHREVFPNPHQGIHESGVGKFLAPNVRLRRTPLVDS
jgi:HupE / UreJ protein